MILTEIQSILKQRLKCSDIQIKTIANVLQIIGHNDSRAKSEIIENIERDSKHADSLN